MKHLTSHISHFTSYLFLLTSYIFLLTSCQYKDLCYDHNHGENYNLSLQLELKLELDVDVEVSVETHTKIEKPDYMKVMFYSPQIGTLSDTEIVGADGGHIYQAPGTYNMLVYSFGTEWTQIRGEGNINTLEAFTSDITATKSRALRSFTRAEDEEEPQGPIIYTPDHLLVAHERVEIPPFSEEERVITLTANAKTVVETYGFQLTNISGIEYISSVEAFVTNQSRSTFFGRGEKSTEPATIYFPIEVNPSDGYIHTSFNTFGKLPGESRSYLHIMIKNTEGEEVKISVDITDQFEKEDHEIIIDDEIDIPAPEGGGIAPTVDPWEEENHDVPIG